MIPTWYGVWGRDKPACQSNTRTTGRPELRRGVILTTGLMAWSVFWLESMTPSRPHTHLLNGKQKC